MAQHPPCVPDIGTTWPAVVADRRQLLGDSRPRSARTGLELETAFARGPSEGAKGDVTAASRNSPGGIRARASGHVQSRRDVSGEAVFLGRAPANPGDHASGRVGD